MPPRSDLAIGLWVSGSIGNILDMYRILRRFYDFLLQYKGRLAVFLFFCVGSSVISSIQPYFFKLFTDSVYQGDYRGLLWVLIIYVGVRLLGLVFDIFTYWTGDWFLIPAARDARVAVFQKVQELDFAYHVKKSTGSLISAFKRGDGAFWSLHHNINIGLLRIFVNFIIVMLFFSRLHWDITVLIFVSFLINLTLARFLIRKNIGARRDFNDAEDEISDLIVDNLINFETVKLFSMESWERSRLIQRFKHWMGKIWAYANSFRLIDIVVGTVSNLSLFTIMFLGVRKLVSGAFSPGDFIMVIGFVNSFYPRFAEVLYKLRNIAKQMTDIRKYFAVFEEEPEVKDPAKAVAVERIEGKIEYRQVGFSYPEGKKDALKDFNLTINPGESVGFVGRSGAGKTTVVKLLMRFHDPNQGQIFLDGIDIRQFKKSQLRSFMGVVPQDPIMFNETIAFNIGYGFPEASRDRIESATKMAHLLDFIESLPAGFETIVGERGIKLSGGQKQRLAIARMVLTQPEIIIFDEATSQLDSESEGKIQEALWNVAENTTTLIIAHRLSTLAHVDKIVVMEDGEIVEMGSHQDLVCQSDSLYQHFWQLQSIE